MFIEIIAEAIRGKSFIAERREEDGDEDSEPRVLGKSNYRRRNKPRQKSVNRSVIVAATSLLSVATRDI